MAQAGYVKLYRTTLDWEWFKDTATTHVWLYILMRVNWEPSKYKGVRIRRGEMLESLATMADKSGLSIQQIRTALNHLKSTGEITTKATRYGTVISVVKYSIYQGLGGDD